MKPNLILAAALLVHLEKGHKTLDQLQESFNETPNYLTFHLRKLSALGYLRSETSDFGGYIVNWDLPRFGELAQALDFATYAFQPMMLSLPLNSIVTGDWK